MSYSLVTYAANPESRVGIVIGEQFLDAADAAENPTYSTMLGVLDDWSAADTVFSKLTLQSDVREVMNLADVKLLAPIPLPRAIYCAGANYRDHVREMNKQLGLPEEPDPHSIGLKPWHFIKASHAVVGPDSTIRIPPESKQLDWEIELAAVIGKIATRVSEVDALNHVAGYTIANDLSARDLFKRPPLSPNNPFATDWLASKSFNGACPLGPCIVPARDVANPQALGLRLSINGELMQDSNTSEMVFTLAEQIAQLSLRITLHPGDVILTGTPVGVGMGRNLFLKDGDQVNLWVENIGTLKHSVSA